MRTGAVRTWRRTRRFELYSNQGSHADDGINLWISALPRESVYVHEGITLSRFLEPQPGQGEGKSAVPFNFKV
jgi:hypothetical protein